MLYEKIYRCRMCGDIFTKGTITDELKVYSNMIDLVNGRTDELYVVHYCTNGNIGIAELQGMKLKPNF